MPKVSIIRSAKEADSDVLTDISFNSKRYWKYPEEYFRVWESELTISPGYIGSNDVWVYEKHQKILGYYSLVVLENEMKVGGIIMCRGHWLEHMFIRPRYIGMGIGAELFHHLRNRCIMGKIEKLNIFVDPNARGFYEKMGCRFVKEFPSTIVGRTTPYLILSLPTDD